MKHFFICLLVFTNLTLFGQQKIYKNFVEGMTNEEATQTFENNVVSLSKIDFTTNVSWDVAPQRFIYTENKLKVVALIPNGMGNGFNYIKTFTHLKESKGFLENLGYKVILENKWWDRPQNFVDKNYAYGLVLESPDKKIQVNLYTYRVKGSYIPVIYIYPSNFSEIHFRANKFTVSEETGF